MKYTLKYLPVDKPIEDGCTIMDIDGRAYVFNSNVGYSPEHLAQVKVCELFLVAHEFNRMKVIGRPAPDVLKWLKPGESVKSTSCEVWYKTIQGEWAPSYDIREPIAENEINTHWLRVECPTCGVLH